MWLSEQLLTFWISFCQPNHAQCPASSPARQDWNNQSGAGSVSLGRILFQQQLCSVIFNSKIIVGTHILLGVWVLMDVSGNVGVQLSTQALEPYSPNFSKRLQYSQDKLCSNNFKTKKSKKNNSGGRLVAGAGANQFLTAAFDRRF